MLVFVHNSRLEQYIEITNFQWFNFVIKVCIFSFWLQWSAIIASDIYIKKMKDKSCI